MSKRQASSFSVTGGSTFIQGGSFTTDISAKLNGEMYSCVQNGEQWVVLPKVSVVVYNEATHGNVYNSDFHNLIMNAENGSIFYLTKGTYRLNDGSTSRFTDKSFTLVGLEGAVHL